MLERSVLSRALLATAACAGLASASSGQAPPARDKDSTPLLHAAGSVTVLANQPPTVRFQTTPPARDGNPYPTVFGEFPLRVSLNLCQSSDPDPGDSLRFDVTWGDGFATGPDKPGAGTSFEDGGGLTGCDGRDCCRHRHVFEREGTFTVEASVSDKHLEDQGNAVSSLAVVRQRITVRAGSPPPPPLTTPGSLTTTFASNNGFAGNTFDLQSSVSLQIKSFDVNLDTGCTSTVTFYWKNGTAVGSENTAGAWTPMGSATVTSAGSDLPTSVPVGGLTLTPGQVYGIYMDDSSACTRYTNGANTIQNSDLKFVSNTGQASPPFSGSFFPRTWNGTVHYVK